MIFNKLQFWLASYFAYIMTNDIGIHFDKRFAFISVQIGTIIYTFTINPLASMYMSFLLALPCHSPAINEVVFDKTKLNFSKWVYSAQDFKCSAYFGCVADGWNNINANLHNVFANEPAFRRLTYSQCIKITHFVEYVTCTESWDCKKWIRGKKREKYFWINRVMLLKRPNLKRKKLDRDQMTRKNIHTHNPRTRTRSLSQFGILATTTIDDVNHKLCDDIHTNGTFQNRKLSISIRKGCLNKAIRFVFEPIGIVGLTKKPHETLNRIWDKHMCVTPAWPCIDSMDYRIMSISISIPTISDVHKTRFYVFTLFTGLYDRFKYLNRDFNSIFTHPLCFACARVIKFNPSIVWKRICTTLWSRQFGQIVNWLIFIHLKKETHLLRVGNRQPFICLQ